MTVEDIILDDKIFGPNVNSFEEETVTRININITSDYVSFTRVINKYEPGEGHFNICHIHQ